MRIGLVGLDSTHADHIVNDFNVDRAFASARVTALCGDTDRAQELARAGAVSLVVDDPAALLGHVDAVIVADRDGRRHRANAMPFLTEGVPVLVGKPLATDLDDAVVMVDTARRHGAPLASYSALRWADGLDRVRAAVAASTGPFALLAVGPADPASPWGGLSYYAVHMVEAALSVVDGAVGPISVFASDGLVTAVTTVAQARVVFTFVRPAVPDAVPYQLSVAGPEGVAGGELTLPEHYLRPGLARFVDMVRTGEQPLSDEELLAPVTILAGIEDALRRSTNAELSMF